MMMIRQFSQICPLSYATKVVLTYEKPKQNSPNRPFYNIIYDLTTLFKENNYKIDILMEHDPKRFPTEFIIHHFSYNYLAIRKNNSIFALKT